MAENLEGQYGEKSIRLNLQRAQRERNRRERSPMMDRRTEPVERGEMFGHAVAHVALEAITRMGGAETGHEAVARDFGDDRGGRDRRHQAVAADDGLTV